MLNVKRGIKMGGMDQAYEIEIGAKQTIDHRLARLASCPNDSNGNTFANHFDLEVLRDHEVLIIDVQSSQDS